MKKYRSVINPNYVIIINKFGHRFEYFNKPIESCMIPRGIRKELFSKAKIEVVKA